MNKFFIFTLIFSICISMQQALADSLEDYANIDRLWDGQKSITNKEFEQVMDALQEKKKKKEEKAKAKKIKKISGGGNTLHSDENYSKDITEMPVLGKNDEGCIVSMTVNAILGDTILEKGFYNVIVDKSSDGKIYFNFYQSQIFKGKIEAIITEDDFDKDNLNFVEIRPYNDTHLLCIYGSLKYNAYAYIPFTE